MSQQLISRSPDLKRLRDEGHHLEVAKSNHLLVRGVPYVNSKKEVRYGTLVSELTIAGSATTKPGTHVALFVGEHPCDKDGVEISGIKHTSTNTDLGNGLVVNHSFSNKPKEGYSDYYQMITRYIEMISAPALSLDPSATAKSFPVLVTSGDESVFNYLDSASSRAGISALTNKLALKKIAIVGLGGTGSYVLDLVSKTPVEQIHLFDGDTFLNHNAFRSPGAPSVEELEKQKLKVTYFQELYSRMHRGIVAHPIFIGPENIDELQDMGFVFLSMDRGGAKGIITKKLEEWNIPFVDVGMGVELGDESLGGIVRGSDKTLCYWHGMSWLSLR